MAHIHERLDFTASIYVVYQNKLLLRMHDKYNIWLPPGGHVELGEDPIEAALRELEEEAGLHVMLWAGERKGEFEEADGSKELIPPVSVYRSPISATHDHVNFAYFGTSITDVLTPRDAEASSEMRWCTKKDLETMDLRKDIRFFANLALETFGA